MAEHTEISKENLGDFILEIIGRIEQFDNHPMIKPPDVNFPPLPDEIEEMKQNAKALIRNLDELRTYYKDHQSDGLQAVIRQVEERVAIVKEKNILAD